MQVCLSIQRLETNSRLCSQFHFYSTVLESLLSLSLHILQNRSPVRARGSIGVDTAYLDKQVEEKRLRDAQIAHREKQEGETCSSRS